MILILVIIITKLSKVKILIIIEDIRLENYYYQIILIIILKFLSVLKNLLPPSKIEKPVDIFYFTLYMNNKYHHNLEFKYHS